MTEGGVIGFSVDAEQGPELLDLEETEPARFGPAIRGRKKWRFRVTVTGSSVLPPLLFFEL